MGSKGSVNITFFGEKHFVSRENENTCGDNTKPTVVR